MKVTKEPYGQKLADMKYENVNFVWVSDHYDFHRDGICMHDGKLCRFSCIEDYPDNLYTCSHADNNETCSLCDGSQETIVCSIHELTAKQQKRWLRRKRWFERCVSHHWSYPRVEEEYRRTSTGVLTVKRTFLKRLLFMLYFLPSSLPSDIRYWPRWLRNRWRYS